MLIDDIIWLERIVEKLAWKHNILTSEVEEGYKRKMQNFQERKGKS